MAGFLLLQFGMTSKQTVPATSQLAVAERGADKTANRGSGGLHLSAQPNADQLAAGEVAPQDTTTTVAPTTTTVAPTTTTVAPTTTTAKPKPVTTTTAKPKPVTTAPPAGAGVIGDDVWSKLAGCESGNKNDSSGPYYGYFQFSPSTWTSLGGTGLPSDHTYDEQKTLAIALQARSGWGQWPVCSKKVGAA